MFCIKFDEISNIYNLKTYMHELTLINKKKTLQLTLFFKKKDKFVLNSVCIVIRTQ